MNWKELKKKYPKAWAKMVNGEISVNDPRDLFDFFDDNEIYISPRITLYEIDNIKQFECDIYGSGFRTARLIWYKNRSEAETAAFNKAFEILENRIK